MAEKTSNQSTASWGSSLWAAAIAYVLTYLFASWAIDSGKILPHIFAYIAVYYGVYYTKETIKRAFFQKKNHDKPSKARAAKKAHKK